MIKHAGFFHSSEEKQFSYEYLSGTHLLQTLTKPNNMSLTLSYETQRDLLTGMSYKRGNTGVASRTYTYDAAGRPITRNTARNGTTVNDSFGYNNRSELTAATVNNGTYSYNYDNIGNRNTAQEITEEVTNYTANNLNQYTAIGDFAPTYDAAGNQTLVKTTTGIWTVAYDAENRPVSFTNAETNTVIECAYDHMGRRATKKVTVNGSITLHHRYLYRGYLQIACCDLTRSNHPALWLIAWDPTQPIATRPLAIQKDGTWYTYGWDLTKNICELYGQHGYIRTNYTYTPYGAVTTSGDVTQPIQWSSEFHDDELALVYYNYRHYNPTDGRWLGRDSIESTYNAYLFIGNVPVQYYDEIGLLFSQNSPDNKICCNKCETYLKHKIQEYSDIIHDIRQKGCNLDFRCETLKHNVLGYTKRTNHLNPFSNISIQIVINCTVGATQSLDSTEDTFGHELIHAKDHCDGKLNWRCESSICSEIRAYSVGGCKHKTGPELIECLKRRVPLSADSNCWLLDKNEISEMIPLMYNSCVK